MQEIRYQADAVRYIYSGPAGLLEFRAFATLTGVIDVLIFHQPGCDAESCDTECDCEFTAGQEIGIAWDLAGNADAAVWGELARRAVAAAVREVPQPPCEPSAEQRGFAARLRAVGEQMERDGEFTPLTNMFDLEAVPGPVIVAARRTILACWSDDRSLKQATEAAAEIVMRQAVLKHGFTPDKARRRGLFVLAVGARMASDASPY